MAVVLRLPIFLQGTYKDNKEHTKNADVPLS